eukprot:6147432-Amphidinium_carterae.1
MRDPFNFDLVTVECHMDFIVEHLCGHLVQACTMSAQDWQADVNSGTLSWFGTPTYSAATTVPPPAPE